MKNFKLSERQSTAILEMRLQRLTNLERDKIIQDYKNILKPVSYTHLTLPTKA